MFVLILIMFLLVLLVLYLRRNYGTLEKLGIPVVKPSFCLGSGPLLIQNYNLAELDYQRFQQYGKVYGVYVMSTPWVYISDADILRQIHIKDFQNFPDHSFVISNQKYRTLDISAGENWKDLRKGLSPTFTSGKIKGMLDLMGSSMDNMIHHLEKQVETNPVVDMKSVFQCLTLDIIAKVAFGLESNTHEDQSSELYKMAKKIGADTQVTDTQTAFFVNLASVITGADMPLAASFDYFWRFTKKVQTQRAASGIHTGDFIDRLNDMTNQLKKGEMPTVTEDQITAQGIVFLLAGYETTAQTLGSLSYHLVKNPEVLETLMREVDDVLEAFQGKVDHETIADMSYLDACVKETLRILPPVFRNERLCRQDWEYKGLKIKKGTIIGIPIHVIHHDPAYWPEPELFRPDRFLKENAGNIVPCSWLPFGSGPRACIGERFAMVEVKVAIVKLLQAFHIQADDTTRLNLVKGDMFLSTYTDINVRLSPRQ